MKRRSLITVVVLWLVLVSAGFGAIYTYQFDAAPAKAAVDTWPDAPGFLADGRASLLMFVHPLCPCTRATISELARLQPRIPADVALRVILYAPTDPARAQEWAGKSIDLSGLGPAVKVTHDPGGSIARSFGATTSGELLLYSAEGRLLFQGGITSGRGHEGGNASQDILMRALNEKPETPARVPVFGCGLYE